MANIISASEVLAADGGGLYLSKEEKASLHNEQRPFWITNATGEQDGQFGPQSVFYIREKNGQDAKLAFGVSEPRKELARKITTAIANGADAVGPFYLGRWENGNRSGWTLTPEPTTPMAIPEHSSTQPDVVPPSVKAGGKPAHQDDDIPFAASII
jgi:hypothetical protein